MSSLVRSVMCAAALLGSGATVAGAVPLTYAVNTSEDLYAVDVAGAGKTLVGHTGIFLQGLALSPGGVLFGTDGSGYLYRIDRTTAVATLVGDTGLGNIEGLDFKGNTLLATNFATTPTVYAIDTTTAATSNVVAAAVATGRIRTMTVVDANTVLIRGNGPPNNTLYALNLTTGAVATIGTLAVNGSQFAAMDFLADGLLYGLDNDGSVWRINPATAAVTLLGDTGDEFWLDMTTGPDGLASTPEPASIVLFGTAMLVIGLTRHGRGIGSGRWADTRSG